jgi:hypothetical protein
MVDEGTGMVDDGMGMAGNGTGVVDNRQVWPVHKAFGCQEGKREVSTADLRYTELTWSWPCQWQTGGRWQ